MIGRSVRTGERGIERGSVVVGLVDLVLIASLVILGRIEHGYPILGAPVSTLETLFPFVVGWLLVAVVASPYAREALTSSPFAARAVAVTWLAGANVGLILRSSPLFDGGASWPFNLVITGLGLVVLVTWRVAYVRLIGSSERAFGGFSGE